MIPSAFSVGASSRRTCRRAREHRRAGRLDELVDPDDEALVTVGLHLDAALGAADLLGHVDHLVPRLGRGRHEVLAVPQQLRVRPDRRPCRACPRSAPSAGPSSKTFSVTIARGARPARARSSRRWRTRRSTRRRGRCRSSDGSSAPRRRTSCSRCWSACEGRYSKLILYLPPDCCEQRSAVFCGPPLGSLKMNQLRVTAPPSEESSSPARDEPRSRARPLRSRWSSPSAWRRSYPAELVAKLTNYRILPGNPLRAPSSRGAGVPAGWRSACVARTISPAARSRPGRVGGVDHDDVVGATAIGEHALGDVVDERETGPSARRAAMRSRYSASIESGCAACWATPPPSTAIAGSHGSASAVVKPPCGAVVVPEHRVAVGVAAGAIARRIGARARRPSRSRRPGRRRRRPAA